MSIIVKILWNLLCQYNNININLHQYLKEKKIKKHKPITGEKKKDSWNQSTIAATVRSQCKTHWMYNYIYKRGKKSTNKTQKKKKRQSG